MAKEQRAKTLWVVTPATGMNGGWCQLYSYWVWNNNNAFCLQRALQFMKSFYWVNFMHLFKLNMVPPMQKTIRRDTYLKPASAARRWLNVFKHPNVFVTWSEHPKFSHKFLLHQNNSDTRTSVFPVFSWVVFFFFFFAYWFIGVSYTFLMWVICQAFDCHYLPIAYRVCDSCITCQASELEKLLVILLPNLFIHKWGELAQ